ncbi:hypothetical protein [Streptomyces sp. NBC_00645]|uniref:hypothetical protein n=1 Tax=Streptomyces sp. NBC_00645 TaxID=2975795 RepID=UPI003248AFB5
MSEEVPEVVPDEDHSTGTAWRAPHIYTPIVLPPHITPCTPDEQARHYAALSKALSGLSVRELLRRHTNSGADHA